jgi:hypothetical protein
VPLEQLTPASPLLQGRQTDLQILTVGTAHTPLSPESLRYPTPSTQRFQPGVYPSTNATQFPSTPNMLPSPSIAETDNALVAPSDCVSVHDPLAASIFGDLAGYNSEQWLLDEDFDSTIFEHMGFSGSFDYLQIMREAEIPGSLPRQFSSKPKRRPAVSDLRRLWYIQIADDESEAGSGSFTPQNKAAGSFEHVDELYRDKLVKVLRPSLRDEPLPSIEFLNLSIHLFFTRFNVALPLIHSPTFRPRHCNPLLVLSICSAGCLSLASDMGAKAGAMLFERVNKAVLVAPWEKVLPRADDFTWDVAKAAMIGQTYALTSADPSHRATAAAYHGSLIALARHHKLLSPAPTFELQEDLTTEELHKAWRKWARREELRRVAVLLYIHDAELAALFHHEPVFRHNAGYIPQVCSHELFSAPTAAIWESLFRAEQRETSFQARVSAAGRSEFGGGGQFGTKSQRTTGLQNSFSYQNMFNVYNGLSGIAASICECRHLDLLSPAMVNKIESDLLTWYASTPKAFKIPSEHLKQMGFPFNMLPFWHATFITLCTDLNLLELAAGREGTEIAPSTREYVLAWIASPASKRCLFHALLLQKLIIATNLGSLVAFNTPRILFSAALCWYCYMMYVPDSVVASGSSAPSFTDGILEALNELPEIQLLREGADLKSCNYYPVPHVLDEAIGALPKLLAANPAEMKAETICMIECILRRLGTSGISLRFADIIQVFISGTIDRVSGDEGSNGGRSQLATI